MPGWLIPAIGVALSPLPILAMLLVLGAGPLLIAAVGVAQAGDENGEITRATAGFVALAVSTVTLLLAGYASRLGRSGGTLTRLRGTVARHDRTIAVVLPS
jgi:hypothetical protein